MPKMTFSLPPVKEMLSIIREAFDNRTLQMFNEKEYGGSYNGPCAIGVCLTQEQKDYCDANEFGVYVIDDLVDAGIITGLSPDEVEDLFTLQDGHDILIGNFDEEYRIKSFEHRLIPLEEKYSC